MGFWQLSIVEFVSLVVVKSSLSLKVRMETFEISYQLLVVTLLSPHTVKSIAAVSSAIV